MEKPQEIEKSFPGEVTSKPRLEEGKKIARLWKKAECISDTGGRDGTYKVLEGDKGPDKQSVTCALRVQQAGVRGLWSPGHSGIVSHD